MKCADTLELERPATAAAAANQVRLPMGLLGFEQIKDYVLLANPTEAPFAWLQVEDNASLAFVVINPFLVAPDYQPDIPESDVEFLGLEEASDAHSVEYCDHSRFPTCHHQFKRPDCRESPYPHWQAGHSQQCRELFGAISFAGPGNCRLIFRRMLILSRKPGECIVIDGRIHVKIVRVEGDVVKVGIEAPPSVPVHRLEVYEEIQRSNQQALTRQSTPLPKLTGVAVKKQPVAVGPGAGPAGQKTPVPSVTDESICSRDMRPGYRCKHCQRLYRRSLNHERPLAPSPDGLGLFPVRPVIRGAVQARA
jgi:carbon storage regulator